MLRLIGSASRGLLKTAGCQFLPQAEILLGFVIIE
jgi:hypothetical protein